MKPIFVVLLLLATPSYGASFGTLAEEELKLPHRASHQSTLNTVEVANAPSTLSEGDAQWTAGISLQRFSPQGTLKIATGDQYDLNQAGTQTMVGFELCRNLSVRRTIGICGAAQVASSELELRTSSGYKMNQLRLTHLETSLLVSTEKTWGKNLLLSLGGEAGAGAQLMSQSGGNLAGNALAQNIFAIASPFLRFSKAHSSFFAKLAYQRWFPNADHFLVTGGLSF